MKYFDSSKAATSIAASTDWTGTELDPGTLDTVFAPTVGSAINQRIGRKVHVVKISIKGTIIVTAQTGQSAGDGRSVIRLSLVQDNQTNGVQMQGEEVYRSEGAAALNVHSHRSLDNLDRFRVLKDKVMILQNPNAVNDTGSTGGIVQQGLARTFKLTHKFANPPTVNFNGTNGGTIADTVNTSWHVIGCTDSAALAPQIVYTCRVYYKE